MAFSESVFFEYFEYLLPAAGIAKFGCPVVLNLKGAVWDDGNLPYYIVCLVHTSLCTTARENASQNRWFFKYHLCGSWSQS